MNGLLTLETLVARAARAVAFLGLAGLLLQALTIFADVILRWLFDAPIHGLEDINRVAIGVIVACFFPMLLIERKNVSLRFFGMMFGPRGREWLNVFGHLVTLVFITVVAWQLGLHAGSVAAQESLILKLPSAPGWWAAAAIFWFCVPVQLVVMLVHVGRAVIGREHRSGAESEFG